MAAAAYAEDEHNPPPRELIWHWRIQTYGLPYAGGWMEQPAGLLDRIREVAYVYEAMTAYLESGCKAGSSATWKEANPEYWDVVKKVRELRNGS